MEKTYKIIENPVSMSMNEIDITYDGYWVYLVNVIHDDEGTIIAGTPVVIGETTADGVEYGIYEKYRAKEYEPRAGHSLLHNPALDKLIEELRSVGGEENCI